MLLAGEGTARQVPLLVDLATGIQRAQAKARGLGVGLREAVSRVSDPNHDDVVRVRYIAPPPDVQAEIDRRASRGLGRRELVRVDINHMLLAACRKDQTAADATIQGTANGAFTFHLCKVLREGGANLDRKVLIKRVEEGMAAEHFDQSPQLETSLPEGPLFSSSKVPEQITVTSGRPPADVPTEGSLARPPAGTITGWRA
jgi:hypothetical protein